MAASDDEELATDHAGRVKPPGTWLRIFRIDLNLVPTFGDEVKDPEIVHIGESLSSEDYEIGVIEFCDMVGPFPGCGLVLLGGDLSPDFGLPIEDTDGVESLFVGSSSSEDYHLIMCRVVVESAVGAMCGFLAGGVDFLPGLEGGVVGPEIVHVVGVWVDGDVPAYPPKKRT